MRFIKNAHDASQKLSFGKISEAPENTYIIESEDGARKYRVKRMLNKCVSSNCKMICRECNTCTHLYSCTCTDYLLKGNICKHIHLLHRYIQRKNIETDSDEDVILPNECNEELNVLDKMVSTNSTNDDRKLFEALKKNTEGSVLELLQEISTCTQFDVDALKHASKQITSLKSTLMSMKKQKPAERIELKVKHFPSNKNIEKQRRFYSTQRKEKNRRKEKLALGNQNAKKNLILWLRMIGNLYVMTMKENCLMKKYIKKVKK